MMYQYWLCLLPSAILLSSCSYTYESRISVASDCTTTASNVVEEVVMNVARKHGFTSYWVTTNAVGQTISCYKKQNSQTLGDSPVTMFMYRSPVVIRIVSADCTKTSGTNTITYKILRAIQGVICTNNVTIEEHKNARPLLEM